MKKRMVFNARLVILCFILLVFNSSGQGQTSDIFNNGRMYVKFNDVIYYRYQDPKLFEPTVLWADFVANWGSPTELMALEEDKSPRSLFVDYGGGNIFAYRDSDGIARLLLSGLEPDGEEAGEFSPFPSVYSVDLESYEPRYYCTGQVFDLDEKRSLAIISGYRGSILVLDLQTEETEFLIEAHCSPIHYERSDGTLFYFDVSGYDDYLIKLMTYNVKDGEHNLIFTATKAQLGEMTELGYWSSGTQVQNTYAIKDDFYMYLTFFEGTGNFYGDSLLLKIKKDGSSYEVVAEPKKRDWFGENKPFQLNNQGPFYADSPVYYVFTDDSLEKKEIISPADLRKIGLIAGEYISDTEAIKLGNVEYMGDEVFFTMMTGIRNKDEDIGWRWAYDLDEIRVYRKDLMTGRITLVHGFSGFYQGNLEQYLAYLSMLDRKDASSVRRAIQAFLSIQTELTEEEREEAFLGFKELYDEVVDELCNLVWERELQQGFYYLISDEDGYQTPELLKKLNDPNEFIEDEDLRNYVASVLRNGMRFNTAEGSIFIEPDPGFLVENFGPYLSDAFREYFLLIQAEEEEGFVTDAYLLISFKDLAKRITVWEEFLLEYPDFSRRDLVEERHGTYLWVFLQGIDNSPLFSYHDGILEPEAKSAYEWFILENADRPSGDLVREFYQLLEKEKFRRTESITKFYNDNWN